jgi:AraC family transcriptional regulator of adaptative response / DNA-3-methyladenine glycosylase II
VILPVREPLEWTLLLDWLGARAITGLETVADDHYERMLADGEVLTVGRVADGLHLEGRADPALVARLFDAGHDPAALAAAFDGVPVLGELLARAPGIRVPGTWSGFELAVRAVLGQQVSVAGARRTAEKLLALHGGRFPEPEALAAGPLPGMPAARERALRALAEAVAGGLRLDPPLDVAATRAALLELPGFGPWTVEYIAMRALRDRDAWPGGDLHLRRAAAGTDPERWRPWRAYAAMLLWQVT